METRTVTIATPDGRDLRVLSGGDESGRPVLVHGGTPNSRLLADGWLEDAERRGILLISYDRPGYGGSTPQPGRSVADCAVDVEAIARALGIERLAVWGYSGGGPHALACAALLPDLVTAVVTLASVAPYGAPGLDYFTGMGQDNVDGFTLFLKDPAAARKKGAQDREDALKVTAETMLESWAPPISSSACKTASLPETRVGGTTASQRSRPGGSPSTPSRCRSSSGMGPRTGSCRSSMASGSHSRYPASRRT